MEEDPPTWVVGVRVGGAVEGEELIRVASSPRREVRMGIGELCTCPAKVCLIVALGRFADGSPHGGVVLIEKR
jgi:hypothetical protein